MQQKKKKKKKHITHTHKQTNKQNKKRNNTAHPSPDYYQAADFILSQAKSLSLHSQTLEVVKGKPLILLKWPGKHLHLPSILLNSHTDVVPVEPHKCHHPPFDAAIDSHNGNIYARGSQDMKCVGLQYLELSANSKNPNPMGRNRTKMRRHGVGGRNQKGDLGD